MNQASKIKQAVENSTESQWKELYMEHAVGTRSDILPFPSEKIQVITNNQKGESTARGAIAILDCILELVNKQFDSSSLKLEKRVLDYGCGWGRMTRLLPYYFDIDNISGVDVDESFIASANELLPFLDHRVIESMKPLPFEDESYDVIFANSVFTHLSEKSALATMKELSRVLVKDGCVVLSTLGEHEINKFYGNEQQKQWITGILGDQSDALATLKKEGFVWGTSGRWHEYGIAAVEEGWVERKFSEMGLEYQGTATGAHAGSQNYMVGIKK